MSPAIISFVYIISVLVTYFAVLCIFWILIRLVGVPLRAFWRAIFNLR